MSYKSDTKALLKLSFPLILTQIAQVGITFTDTLMMGILGQEALGGAGLGAAIFSFLGIIALGVLTVVGNKVAKLNGDKPRISQVVNAGSIIAIATAVILITVLWSIGPFLVHMGQAQDVAEVATLYLRAIAFGMLPYLLFINLRAFLIGVMHQKAIIIITTAAIGLNVIMNLFFIHYIPSLGVIGLGLASVIVFICSLLALVIVIKVKNRFKPYKLFNHIWQTPKADIIFILKNGIPMALIYAFEAGFFTLSVFLVGFFGEVSLAAHNIAIQLTSLTYMISLGIAGAISILVSKYLGQHDIARIKRITTIGIIYGTCWMVISAALFLLIPGSLVGLFTRFADTDMQPIFNLAVQLLMIAAFFQLVDGLQGIVISILRGLEATHIGMKIAFFGYWIIGAPLAYCFGFVLQGGPAGVWWGLASGLAATGLIGWGVLHIKLNNTLGRFANRP
jgi:MATE family multidrug resistance protein